MHQRRYLGLGTTVLATVALTLTACGGAGAGASGSAGDSSTTIGFSMPNLSSSFWISVAYGVDQQAKAENATVIKTDAGGDGNADQQISQLQDLIQRDVDVLIVGATNGDAIKAVVEEAVAAGIPVVGISALPNTDKLVSKIGADHYGMGKLQAECLGEAVGGAGAIGMMSGPAGQSWADDRAQGFRETLSAEFPDLEVVTEDRNAVDRATGLSTMQAWMARYPDMVGAYTAYDDMGAGAVDAIKAGNKTGQIKVSSSNFTQIGEQLLKSGDLVCETTQQVVLQGTEAVKAAVAAASGGTPEAEVTTSVIAVTKDNMDSLDFSTIRAPEGYTP